MTTLQRKFEKLKTMGREYNLNKWKQDKIKELDFIDFQKEKDRMELMVAKDIQPILEICAMCGIEYHNIAIPDTDYQFKVQDNRIYIFIDPKEDSSWNRYVIAGSLSSENNTCDASFSNSIDENINREKMDKLSKTWDTVIEKITDIVNNDLEKRISKQRELAEDLTQSEQEEDFDR